MDAVLECLSDEEWDELDMEGGPAGPPAPPVAHDRTYLCPKGQLLSISGLQDRPEKGYRARRFLLRDLANVNAEWSLPAAALNPRSLARIWGKSLLKTTNHATAPA